MKSVSNSIFILLVSWMALSCSHSAKIPETSQAAEVCLRPQSKPLIVGHRGAPGHVPEHTLRSYSLAIELGADVVEPDLVMTKDNVLIARHENEISETTNVSEVFPSRKTVKVIDGEKKEGFFTEDFTLAEIKKLKAKERLASRSHAEDGLHQVPTLEEIIQLVQQQEKLLNKKIGLIPEIKHSTYFRGLHFDVEKSLVGMLKKHKLNTKDSFVMIQSFEVGNLKNLRKMTPVSLVQLIEDPNKKPYDVEKAGGSLTYMAMISDAGLADIKKYADWVSPHKGYIVQVDAKNQTHASDLVARAHKAGLKVMPYTFRSDKEFLSPAYKGNPSLEYLQFFNLGVDGLFTDFSDDAVKAWKSATCL